MPTFLAFCDAVYRVVVLLALALAPYAAPVEAAPARTVGGALARLLVVVALAFGALVVVRRRAAVDKPLAIGIACAWVATAVAAWAFQGERGPLARGACYVAPFAWGALLLAVTHGYRVRAAEREGRRARAAVLALAIVALGAGSALLAKETLGSSAALWRRTLAADPGNVDASLAVARELRQGGDRAGAHDALLACKKAHPCACACEEDGAWDAIDLGRYEEARAALEAPGTCPRTPRRMGLTAEGLIGTDAIDEGLRQADLALQADPNEPHAAYARAWGAVRKGSDLHEARTLAEQAVRLDRGACAELLLGQIDFKLGEPDAAAPLFQAALRRDPTSVDATYDVALIAQQRGQYHDAREGYLRALHLSPGFADARFNLVGLTLGIGAIDEAQHHLDELAALHPADPRIPALRIAIGRARAQSTASHRSP